MISHSENVVKFGRKHFIVATTHNANSVSGLSFSVRVFECDKQGNITNKSPIEYSRFASSEEAHLFHKKMVAKFNSI